jgi:transmembrane sensor
MMFESRSEIEEQAVEWVIRTRDPAFAGWEEFTEWLERNPNHSRVYNELVAADAELADALLDSPRPAPRPIAVPERHGLLHPSRRGFVGWAIAASLVAVVGYSTLMPGSSTYPVETAAGARRTVTLADGSRIDLNGATRLVLDRENPRLAKLERGEALFTVVHDEARPFVVEAGDATLLDAGTVFNVVRTPQALEVAVSEGEVVYNPEAEKVRLRPGRALRSVDGEARVWVGEALPQSIGSWRNNELVYSSAPLATLAADLSRNLGVSVSVDGPLAARPFSGVIRLEGDRGQIVPQAAAVAGAQARRTDQGWLLTARTDASR